MITTLTTPHPVYWLLDAIQTVGIIGILLGVWYLPVAFSRRPQRVKITLPTSSVQSLADAKKHRSERGAGRIESLLAWTVLVGIALVSWAFLIYGLVSVAKAGH
jgi:hypothetical protein